MTFKIVKLTFIDCQDFKLLHAHWWFWEEGVVVICPQSSGENCFSLSLLIFLIWPPSPAFLFLTPLLALLSLTVLTPGPWRLHAADAGRRLSVPGHVSFPLVRPGSGAAAGPKQPESDLFNQDMTSSLRNSLLMTES